MVITLLGGMFVARSGEQDVLSNQRQVLRWYLLHVPSVSFFECLPSLLSQAQLKFLPGLEVLTSVGRVNWSTFSLTLTASVRIST